MDYWNLAIIGLSIISIVIIIFTINIIFIDNNKGVKVSVIKDGEIVTKGIAKDGYLELNGELPQGDYIIKESISKRKKAKILIDSNIVKYSQ